MVAIGEHYRPVDDAVPPGIYRVVGTADPVVVLRVGAEDGGRVTTGEIYEVSGTVVADSFEPAANPDDGFAPVRSLRNAVSGLYWQFRRFF